MNLLYSRTYQCDLELAAQNIDIQFLKNKKILITGASGLIGSALIDLLVWCNIHVDTRMTIYAAGRNIDQLKERFTAEDEETGIIVVAYDALKPIHFDFYVDFIIHGAGNASPDLYVKQPVDTMMSNILGLYSLLQYMTKHHTHKMVYISSSEVYGNLNSQRPLKETVLGMVDFMNIRSSYPVAKRAGETLCISYAQQFDTDISIVRPGHVYGPTASQNDQRVSSLFARQAAAGENIIMKSAGNQLRSYCYCLDCATAIITVLTAGVCPMAYNISNADSVISIRELATLYARAGHVELENADASLNERTAFNPMDYSVLDGNRLEDIGWKAAFNAEIGTNHTIKILQECTS